MFDDSRPIFLQLADRLSNEILRGVYAEGEQVPSTNELAAYLRINPATAGKALNLLVDREILFKRRGLGMFVADGARSRIGAERQHGLVTAFIEPLLDEAQALGLSVDQITALVADRAHARAAAPSDTPESARNAEGTS